MVVAARRLAEAEASRVGQGVPLTNPRLYGDYRFLAKEQPGTSASDPFHGYLLGIDGQFEVSGASGKRLDEADRRVEVAQAELNEERSRAAARLWTAWVDVRLAERLVTNAREAVQLQDRVDFASRERLKTGVSGEPEVTIVAVELAALRVELEDALRRREAALLALKDVLDLPHDAVLELDATPVDPRPVPDRDQVLGRALDKRPELVAQRARLALVEATDTRLARETVPRLGVNLGLDAAPASPVCGFVGLSMDIPVAQRNQGPRAIAQAARETGQLRLDVLQRRIAREVVQAHTNYAARLKALEVLVRDALPNAERTQALVEEGWRVGRFDIFSLTSATRQLITVRRERMETLAAVWHDYIELERASGGLTP